MFQIYLLFCKSQLILQYKNCVFIEILTVIKEIRKNYAFFTVQQLVQGVSTLAKQPQSITYIYGMEFFTKVDIPASSIRIDYTSRIAFFGSCFADNISARFAARKFNVLSNPFGTVYNPLSIERQLKRIASGKEFGEEDVFQDEHGGRVDRGSQDARGVQDARGLWHCWDAHGSLSAATREDCIAKLNAASSRAREFLQKADTVFITLGSAFVYYLKDCSAAAGNGDGSKESGNGDARGRVVANCHRQDPRLFERRLISVDEAAEAIRGIIESIRRIKNRDWIATPSARNDVNVAQDNTLHIVFTVSPLRHLGDGAHGNNLSKATLLLAIDKVIKEIASPSARNDTSYFPSYEIVMDELRDYRFYDSDLVHLSKTAEEYIFERMVESYCDDTTRTNIARVEKFMKMANHRIVNVDSPTAIEFVKNCAAQARELEKQIPGLTLHVPE